MCNIELRWFCPVLGQYASRETLEIWEESLYYEGLDNGMSEHEADKCALEDLADITGLGLIELADILYIREEI